MVEVNEKLIIAMEAHTQQYRMALREVERRTGRAGQKIDRNMKQISRSTKEMSATAKAAFASFSALAGVAAVRSMSRMGRESLKMAESIHDMSERTGLASERIQEFRMLIDQNGGSATKADEALTRFGRRIGLAADGLGPAARAVKSLGIEIRDMEGKVRPINDIFEEVVGIVASYSTTAEKAATASEFFGDRAGPELVAGLSQGVAGLKAMGQELKATGGMMDDALIKKGAAASATLRKLEYSLGTAFQSGFMDGFIDEFSGVEDALGNAGGAAKRAGEMTGKAMAAIVEATGEAIRLVTEFENAIKIAGAALLGRFAGKHIQSSVIALRNLKGGIKGVSAAMVGLSGGLGGVALAGLFAAVTAWDSLASNTAKAQKAQELYERSQDAFRDQLDATTNKVSSLNKAMLASTKLELTTAMQAQKKLLDGDNDKFNRFMAFRNHMGKQKRFSNTIFDIKDGSVELRTQIKTLRQEFTKGKISVAELNEEIAKLALANSNNERLIKLSGKIKEMSEPIITANQKIKELKGQLDQLNNVGKETPAVMEASGESVKTTTTKIANAAPEIDVLDQSLDNLIDRLDDTSQQTNQYNKDISTLTLALMKEKITLEEYSKLRNQVDKNLQKALDGPFKDYLAQLNNEVELLNLKAQGLEKDAKLLQMVQELEAQGIMVSDAQIENLKKVIEEREKLTQIIEDQAESQRKADENAQEASRKAEERAQEATRKSIEAQQERAEQSKQIWENVGTDIENNLSSAFRNALDGNLASGKDFANAFLSIMKDMVAQTAQTLVFRPMIGNMMEGIGLPNIGLSSISAGFSQASSSRYGFDPAVHYGTEMPASGGFFGNPLVSTATKVASGFGGNFAANALMGDRGPMANMGGTIGGLLGGLGKVSSTLSSTLGIAGSFAGPLGVALGAFGGNILGGLFGSRKKRNRATVGGRVDPNSGILRIDYSRSTGNGDRQAGENFLKEMQKYTIALAKEGVKLAGRVYYDNQEGTRLYVGPNHSRFQFNPNSKASLDNAVAKTLMGLINPRINDQIGRSAQQGRLGNTPEQIFENINFIKNFDTLFLEADEKQKSFWEAQIDMIDKAAENTRQQMASLGYSQQDFNKINDRISNTRNRLAGEFTSTFENQANAIAGIKKEIGPYTQAMENLHKMYQDSILEIEALGLSVQEFGNQIDDVSQNLQKRMRDGMAKQILQMVDPVLASHESLTEQMEELHKEYLALGLSTEELLVYEKLRRAQIDESATNAEEAARKYATLATSLLQARNNLKLNTSLSPLSAWQRLKEARSQFQNMRDKADQGDEEALGRIGDVSNQYLQYARAYYASSTEYYKIWQEVDGTLSRMEDQVTSQLNEASQQNALIQAQTATLQSLPETIRQAIIDGLKQGLSIETLIKQAASTIQDTTLSNSNNIEVPTFNGKFTTNQASDYFKNNPDLLDAYFNPNSPQYNWARQYGTAQEFAESHFEKYGQNQGRAIPAFAKGGLASAGLALVGEEGPELVNFKAPALVHSANDTMAMIAGSAAGTHALSHQVNNLQKEIVALRGDVTDGNAQLIEAQFDVGKFNINATARVENATARVEKAIDKMTDETGRARYRP